MAHSGISDAVMANLLNVRAQDFIFHLAAAGWPIWRIPRHFDRPERGRFRPGSCLLGHWFACRSKAHPSGGCRSGAAQALLSSFGAHRGQTRDRPGEFDSLALVFGKRAVNPMVTNPV